MVAACALLVACGGGGGDDATESDAPEVVGRLSGTVDGHPYRGVHAIAFARTADTIEILASDKPLGCEGSSFAGSTMVDVDVVGLATGAFPVVDAMKMSAKAGQASADFNAVDGTCGSIISRTATSGMLTVSAVDDAEIHGRVDLTFPGGGRISGPFHAQRCASPPRACR
jgi:hypothetical protein